MVVQKGFFINPARLCFQSKISTRLENKAIRFGKQNRMQNTNKPQMGPPQKINQSVKSKLDRLVVRNGLEQLSTT